MFRYEEMLNNYITNAEQLLYYWLATRQNQKSSHVQL